MRRDVLLIVSSFAMVLSKGAPPPHPESRLPDIIEPPFSRKRGLFTKRDGEQKATLKATDSLLAKSVADRMSIGRPLSQML